MRRKANLSGWLILALLPSACPAAFGEDLRMVDAVRNRNAEAVRSLLEQHADVNTPQPDGTTALAWAAYWDDPGTADLLIGAGANVNTKNDYGVTPLWEACNNGSATMVEKLAQAGADPNGPLLLTGESALMTCARTGNADAVKSLLAHGADVKAKEKQKNQTALMWALEERHPAAARVLVEHGADVRARSKGGFTPLLYAARQGDVESAGLLLEKGADVNESAPGGLRPLLVAIDCGHEALAIFLVEHGADVNAADPNGLTALHYSLRKGISALRGVSLGHSSLVSGVQDYLFRPNMSEVVKTLLNHGANPNARIKADLARVKDSPQLQLSGATPLLLAAATADVTMMKALLAKGADPNLATNDNTTPLMLAAGVGQMEDRTKEDAKQALEAVELLVGLGADVNAASKVMGLTALHGAAFTGANEIIQFLADHGARLDVMDVFGQTPLSIAEGDPNGLSASYDYQTYDYIGPQLHESTAQLLRRLNEQLPGQEPGLTAENATR